MKKYFNSLLIVLLCLCFLTVKAQQDDTLEIQRSKGKVAFARFKANAARNIKNDIPFLKKLLQMNADDSLQLTKDVKDELGYTHHRFQQYYKGIKVDNAEYMVHGKNGTIETANGDFVTVGKPATTASLTEAQALNAALGFVKAKKYKWEDAGMQSLIKQNTGNPNATFYPKGELVIATDSAVNSNNYRLAWKFTISSLDPVDEQLVYVDAINGRLLKKNSLIADANVTCNVAPRYTPTVTTVTGDTYAGGVRLNELRNGVSIRTLNMQHLTAPTSLVEFSNATVNFNSTANWPSFTADRAALDLHWAAEKVLDFWNTRFGRNSLDGAGINIITHFHWGNNFVNAHWVPGAGNRYAEFGDGDGVVDYPLTSLDVVGHELGHGIAEFTANFASSGEAAALNEGFSDIWGASVEQLTTTTKQTWLMGEDITVPGTFNCTRNMQTPKSTAASEGQHPDYYNGTYWSSTGEPHTNSTVLSHWFYLVAQGGVGYSENGDSYSIVGIGMEKAERIAFRAEQFHLTSSANYAAARNATIQSAVELYCDHSPEVLAVTNAWKAVGVGAYASFVPMKLYGPVYICSAGSNYSVPNQPAGITSLVWSSSNTAVATINTAGHASMVSTGTTVLSVVVNGAGGCSTTLSSGTVTSGYATIGLSSSAGSCSGDIQTWTVSANPGSSGYNWNWSVTYLGTNSSIYIYNPGSSSTMVDVKGGGTIKVTYNDACGNAGNSGLTIYSSCHALMAGTPAPARAYSLSPNPSGSTVTITANSSKTPAPPVATQLQKTATKTGTNSVSAQTSDEMMVTNASIKQVKIVDAHGRVVKTLDYSVAQSQVKIDVSRLSAGIYFVSISNGRQVSYEKLVIQR